MRILLDRREWLRLGPPALLGPMTLTARSADSPTGFGRAKSVLVLFTAGGMSQLETWDPKPDAPAEIRGAFGSIATRTPGVRFGEHLPLMASRSDQIALIRSLTHDDTDHGSAAYWTLTGRPHSRKSSNPSPSANDHPTLASAFQKLRPDWPAAVPAVHLNGPLLAPRLPAVGQNSGFLPHRCEPWVLGDPSEPDALKKLIGGRPDLPAARLASREELRGQLDRVYRQSRGWSDDLTPAYRRAAEAVGSEKFRAAFDLNGEPESTRERYGRNRSGQSCLLARRLVEAGVPWVTLFFNHGIRGQDDRPEEADAYGFDTHNDIFFALKNYLLPRFDRAASALLDDMAARGLLDSTLVLCVGEFGRAPLVAKEKNFAGDSPGRKHWAACYSGWAAGAGVRGGLVYGSSDRHGAYPSANAATPGDLAATLLSALGVRPNEEFEDTQGRPYRAAEGEALAGLY